MSQQDFPPPAEEGTSPKAWYKVISSMPEFVLDAAQAAAIDELDALWHLLVEFKSKRNNFLGRSLLNPDVPMGLYLWGSVGRGKTFLMDAFYTCLPYQRKRRIHFHNFMSEVHHEMKLLEGVKDPLVAVADKIAKSSRLLCLDELHVDDVADAMILGRLIALLFERGVVLITTSNFPPDDLYPNGLQRQSFMPAIVLLKRGLKVVHFAGVNDHRLRAMTREPLFLVPDNFKSEERMEHLFEMISAKEQNAEQHVDVMGRQIPVKKVARNVVWFTFKELCGGAHAQEEYLEIAHRFPTVFLSHIPQLSAEQADQAKRFIWLIDVLYDNNVRLVASAAAKPREIFKDDSRSSEFSRTVSRLTEMQTQFYLKQQHRSQRVTL